MPIFDLNNSPFNNDINKNLEETNSLLKDISLEESLWLTQQLVAYSQNIVGSNNTEIVAQEAKSSNDSNILNILYGTESGNCEELAYKTQQIAKKKGIKTKIINLADLNAKSLTSLNNALIIVSTWGDGDPPDECLAFYEDLMNDDAPGLINLNYTLLALGDSSYEQFCACGKRIDERLTKLGANCFNKRVDCDVDFEDNFNTWLEDSINNFQSLIVLNNNSKAVRVDTSNVKSLTKVDTSYDRKNPYPSKLLNKILLNGTGSDKEIWHIEFSLEDSGINYLPGDSLAVFPQNSDDVVNEILKALKFTGTENITNHHDEEKFIGDAFKDDYDITNLNKTILKKYLALGNNEPLNNLISDKEKCAAYLDGRQLIDLLLDYKIEDIKPQDFVSILKKQSSRLYSIASSQSDASDEVHLTVSAVRYNTHEKNRKGVASTYLADIINVDDQVPVYIQTNRGFRLPEDNDVPIIMVGPGTGIAPFRAFLQERQSRGAKGKNWLFFGDQHYTTDFLYQLEWQDYVKEGLLTKIDLAFSRDQDYKIYVQDRMKEQAKELYQWLQDGAHFYVCGDASKMAKDVHQALIEIAQEEGKMSVEDATKYIKELQRNKRYHRDVY